MLLSHSLAQKWLSCTFGDNLQEAKAEFEGEKGCIKFGFEGGCTLQWFSVEGSL